MSAYAKAIGGALSGIGVAVFVWMLADSVWWLRLPDSLQAVTLVLGAGLLGGCGPLLAPRNQYRDGPWSH